MGFKICLVILSIFILPVSAYANGRVFPKEVVAVKIGNTGYVEIKFSENHEDPGECGASKGIFILPSHPGISSMLSVALYAKASKSKLTAWINACEPDLGNVVYNLEVQE